MRDLAALCYKLRRDALEIVMAGKTGHIGGDMSVMEILAALYFHAMNVSFETREDPNRDMFVMSKGHCVESLYAVLAEKGFFSLEEVLREYGKSGTRFIGHPNNKIPGIEMNTGSLGHGLPIAVGIALAQRMDGRPSRTYVVMGDGELAEGSVWEGAMSAGHYRLDNLCAVVDRNRLQISGGTEDVMRLEPLADRFSSFGWNALTADGNDIESVTAALDSAKRAKGKPTVIIAETVKGKGSPLMENDAKWHHRVPTDEEYRKIAADLTEREEALRNG